MKIRSIPVQKIIPQLHLTPKHMEVLYMTGWEQNKPSLMEENWNAPVIKNKFLFMQETFLEFGKQRKFHLLPLPFFKSEGSFEDIVRLITKDKFHKSYIRKFGVMTLKYGSVFLNNAYILYKLYEDAALNLDKVMNLDHEYMIKTEKQLGLPCIKFLRDAYPLERIFKLLLDNDHLIHLETVHLISEIEYTQEEAVKNALPPKPKTLREIHDSISISLLGKRNNSRNIKLNQDIAFLDGKKLFEYTIEVPKDSDALASTSRELKHCVHTYTSKIRSKTSQILNLTKNTKRVYTIELCPTDEGYKLIQFKGIHNANAMEGSGGEPYVKELFRLIKEGQYG